MKAIKTLGAFVMNLYAIMLFLSVTYSEMGPLLTDYGRACQTLSNT